MTDIVKVGGVIPFTTIDFPNHMACVLFLQGCPWNCSYCHNQHLLDMKAEGTVSWQEVIDFLETRTNLLDGVVFSGGEALAQKGLKQAIEEVKKMGFFVALHTNGYNPEALQEVLPLLNWIGLDVKAKFSDYSEKISPNADGKKVEQSLFSIVNSGVPFEVRTTLDPRLIDKNDVIELATTLKSYNVENYALQQYRPYENEKNIPSIQDVNQYFEDTEFLANMRSLIPSLVLRKS